MNKYYYKLYPLNSVQSMFYASLCPNIHTGDHVTREIPELRFVIGSVSIAHRFSPDVTAELPTFPRTIPTLSIRLSPYHLVLKASFKLDYCLTVQPPE